MIDKDARREGEEAGQGASGRAQDKEVLVGTEERRALWGN